MNWLAHLYLSEPDPAFRLGSLLPDFLSPAEIGAMDPVYRPGIDRHHAVDLFTDRHPLFHRSIQRFQPPYRRFGGVLVDVFYDHFLSCRWNSLSTTSLEAFVQDVYADFTRHRDHLPPELWRHLSRVMDANWIGSYGEMEGLYAALERLSRRFRRPFDLTPALLHLKEHYRAFAEDFDAFFPELLAHLELPARR